MSVLTTQQEIEETFRLKESNDLTFAEIGRRLGFSERTARRRYESATLQHVARDISDDELEDFPDVEELDIEVTSDFLTEDRGPIERFEPLTVQGDAMVTCDYHIPLHDPTLINNMISCAQMEGLTKLIIAGDYFNMDSFSSYLPHQPEASLQQEKYDGQVIMRTLLRTFDEVFMIWGNHDFRLTKKLGFKKSFEECIKWMLSDLTDEEMAKITLSELDYLYYYPEENKELRVCHPRNFSSVPLSVPRALAQKYTCGVITAHSHHHAIGVAQNGHDLILEGGGFYHKDRTEYIQKTSKFHEWNPGYTFFKSGVPTLVNPVLGNTAQYEGVSSLA